MYVLPVCVKVRQSHLELQEVRASHRQLGARLEELRDERSLQGLTPHPSSLLCEIEQSMEQEEQEQEREQVGRRLTLRGLRPPLTHAPPSRSYACSCGRPTARSARSAPT